MSESANSEKLADLIKSSGLRFRENKLSYIFDCPKCQKSQRLWMFKDGGRFICWYCAEINGFKGRCEFALAELLSRPVTSIRKELYGSELPSADVFFDIVLKDMWSDDEDEVEVPDMSKLSRVMWSPDYYPIDHAFSLKGAEYLAGRGIAMEVARYYDLRYGPIDKRVAFPVAYQGSLFGWQARYVGSTEWIDDTGQERSVPKILSTDSLSGQRDRVVQFADQLTGTDQAIICEGPVDAIKCHLCKPAPDMAAGNIATMGKAVSDQQIALLKYSGIKRVYLALDPDAEAEVTRLIRAFQPEVEVFIMDVPKPFKDFGEMSMEGVVRAYKTARKGNPGHIYVYLKSPADASKARRRRF